MGGRSRKRRRPAPSAAAGPATKPAQSGEPRPSPLEADAPAARAPRDSRSDANGANPEEPRPSRSEAKNAQVRARLEPLQPGERPRSVVIASVVATLLGVSNLVLFIAGAKIQGQRPNVITTLLFCGLLITAGVGMWRLRYWAVLGFQALLALTIIVFSLFLLRASNLAGVVVSVAVVGLGGWLFWKLVRAMARLQMPSR